LNKAKDEETEGTKDEDSKDEKTGKKGVQQEEEEEKGSETDFSEKPKNFALSNDDAVKWIVHMWGHTPSKYNELSDDEKAVARKVYAGMIPFLKDTQED
jgi:hypothetical protein